MRTLTPGLAGSFARVALANVTREYPRKLDHLLTAPHGDLSDRQMHPAFYGSYDWHSAVHMHWLLVRVLRLHPDIPEATAIGQVLDMHLSSAAIAIERAYFDNADRRTFERPYGWAWLLELQAETLRAAGRSESARRWANALDPLTKLLAGQLLEFISLAPYPIRIGMHPSTAFACILALDYARVIGNEALAAGIGSAARKWHLEDRDAPLAYEPSLADFLSPTLVEAQLMREVLGPEAFRPWLDAFLPRGLGSLASPPVVADRTDAQVVHLDGLSLSRAWALRRIATALEENDPRRSLFAAVADRHLAAGLPQVVGGDYVGEHWLASFAALALGETP
jgi:hypothetical protein